MKKLFTYKAGLFFVISYIITSCAVPNASYINLEVADYTTFNLDPKGYNVAVFGVVPKGVRDSTKIAMIANTVAEKYETDQAMEDHSVAVYTIKSKEYKEGIEGNSTEFYNELSEKSNSQILVLINDLKDSDYYIATVENHYEIDPLILIPYNIKLKVIDNTNNIWVTVLDKVVKDTLAISSNITSYTNIKQYIDAEIENHRASIITEIGKSIAAELSTKWNNHSIMLIDYNSDQKWHNANNKAKNFEFEKAIEIWMSYTQIGDKEKESYAAYNIAVVCHLMGEDSLAKDWINVSLSTFRFYEATTFANYLNSKKR